MGWKQTSRRSDRVRLALSVGLLVAGTVLVTSIGLQPSRGPRHVPPWTAGPAAALATPTPRPSARPRPTPSQRIGFGSPPPARMPYFNTVAGYWLGLQGRWFSLGGAFGQQCDLICGASVVVRTADAGAGIAVDRVGASGDTVRVHGTTLRAVKASWRRGFPEATFEQLRVDGEAAVIASSPMAVGRSVLVLREGRLFLITSARSPFSSGPDVLPGFLAGFHFMAAGCWIEPCTDQGWWADPDPIVAFSPEKARETWRRAGATWGAGPGPGDRSIAGFWRGDCVDNLCAGYVSITTGTPTTGPVIDRTLEAGGASWTRASGSTLEAIAASAAATIGATSIERLTIDGTAGRRLVAEGRELVLIMHRGRVIAITAFAGFLAHNAHDTLEAFLAGFSLVT